MATFKPYVKPYKNKQGMRAVTIQVTHNRRNKYIPTPYYLLSSEVTASGKIKNAYIEDKCKEKIRELQIRYTEIAYEVQDMGVDKMYEAISKKKDTEADLDFFVYAKRLIEKMIEKGNSGTAGLYKTALNALREFNDGIESLGFKELNKYYLKSFLEYIKENRSGNRAPSLYMAQVRSIYNKAEREYNDENNDLVVIHAFPSLDIPEPVPAKKRALTKQHILDISNLPDKGQCYNLARDMFMLSFFLIGTNAVDLYHCSYSDNTIEYERKKTATRRKDRAFIQIDLCDRGKVIVAKYKDPAGKMLLNISQRYSSPTNFNKALKRGLDKIALDVGLHGLTFYAARHSWATIARNEAGIDKYTVHEAINHTDNTMKATDIYLKKDWSIINDANRKVIEYVFGGNESK